MEYEITVINMNNRVLLIYFSFPDNARYSNSLRKYALQKEIINRIRDF